MHGGRLGVIHLESFWSRHRAGQSDERHWVRDNTLVAGLRIGLRETIAFLLQTAPSLDAFESWIWHHALPHGSSPNRAASPRFVQYVMGRPSTWAHNRVWR